MTFPVLGEDVRMNLDALPRAKHDRRVCYNFDRSVLCYGLRGVVINHVLRKARSVCEGDVSVADFMATHEMQRNNGTYSLFSVPFGCARRYGIYIPRFIVGEKLVYFPDSDDLNIFDNPNIFPADRMLEVREYISRNWNPADLENRDVVERGAQYGRDLWESSAKQFKIGAEEDLADQPLRIRELCDILIKYYSTIVSEPAPAQ
jgi:hypothetical protein